MFDSVGKNLDEDAAKRQAQSAAIAAGLAGLAAAVVVCAGLWTVKEVVLDPIMDDEILEVDLAEEDLEMDAPPPPPPPPPPPAAASAEEEEPDDEDDTPQTEEMTEEIVELKEEIKDEMKSDVKPKGVVGGVEGGVEGGVVGGVQGGVVGGVVGGVLGGTGPKVVHHSEVEVKKRVQPDYPSAARGMAMGAQRCLATVYIDEKGEPFKVEIDKCPKVFHPNTEEALLKWRWYPYRADGQKLKVKTKIAVTYKEVG